MRRIVLLALVALLLAACVSQNRPATCGEASVTIELQLTASSLSPNNPSVCRDQEVTLVIEPTADGYFHIHGYDEAVGVTEVVSGEELRLTFTASRSGQFPIEIHPADDPQGVGIGIFTVYEP